jgi:hypothetical protein
MKSTGQTELHLSRPRDHTLRAYKDFVLDMVEALTGQREDDMTPTEWRADWKEFWSKEGKRAPKRKRSAGG